VALQGRFPTRNRISERDLSETKNTPIARGVSEGYFFFFFATFFFAFFFAILFLF
jgi:hypothetical protein